MASDTPCKICFIGCGNIATAIMGGLLRERQREIRITASDHSQTALDSVRQQFGVKTCDNNIDCVKGQDIVVLAVKPNQIQDICVQIRDAISPQAVVVSVAAGISVSGMEKWLNPKQAIVRVMPNTPSLVSKGVAGMFANDYTTVLQKDDTLKMMESVGMAFWVETDAQIDAVIAVSGSGPAYGFYLLEQMGKVGVELGLDASLANEMAARTLLGAAHLALSSSDSATVLLQKVCSPNGTTERAVKTFNDLCVGEHIGQGLHACHQRAEEMTKELNGDLPSSA